VATTSAKSPWRYRQTSTQVPSHTTPTSEVIPGGHLVPLVNFNSLRDRPVVNFPSTWSCDLYQVPNLDMRSPQRRQFAATITSNSAGTVWICGHRKACGQFNRTRAPVATDVVVTMIYSPLQDTYVKNTQTHTHSTYTVSCSRGYIFVARTKLEARSPRQKKNGRHPTQIASPSTT
jgi:hypothetical protein